MVDNESIKDLGFDIESFDRKVNNVNLKEDIYKNKRVIEELENTCKNLYNRIEDYDNDINDSSMTSNKRPLLNKLGNLRNDLDIAKNKLNEKKNRWSMEYNKELLLQGNLTGADKIKTERQMILDQHKETDHQGEMINSIASNIKDTNKNLVGINTELKSQGETMNRIQAHVVNAESEVKQTEKTMGKMERRQRCMKCVGGLAVIVVALLDIALLIYWLLVKVLQIGK